MRSPLRRTLNSLFLTGVAGLALTTVWSVAGPPPPVDVVKEPTKMPPKESKDAKQPASPLDFTVKDIDGKETNLSEYKGKVVMIVNVASKCGFTPQYAGLEETVQEVRRPGLRDPRLPRQQLRRTRSPAPTRRSSSSAPASTT